MPKGEWHCALCQSKDDLIYKPIKDYPDQVWTKELLEDDVFHCKPPPNTKFQASWEVQSAPLKLKIWQKECRRFWNTLNQSLQQIRLAQAAILTYTSTRRARQNFTLRSQELKQTFFKLASNKHRVRALLLNYEDIRRDSRQRSWDALDEFCKRNPSEQKVWFPYGMVSRRRIPRLIPPDEELEGTTSGQEGVPGEVRIQNVPSKTTHPKQCIPIDPTKKKQEEDDLLSLDDLKCCVCLEGHATDENDVLMCDGAQCFRSHHMKCLPKPLTPQTVGDEDEDWFCPLCTQLAELLAKVQSE
ncbi:MAG: hypothetical protein AAGJ35_15815, partial [Myxococcota bacterium]